MPVLSLPFAAKKRLLPKTASAMQASACDTRWMNEALTLARSMRGLVWPNPPVGCVIVKSGEVVGRGRTHIVGRPHAERVALDAAGDRAHGAALYVTLEPCCHWGKTPPCADGIIAAGVVAVHASLQDPDPRVNGGGFAKLQQAGIVVDVGLGALAASEIMAGFFKRLATGQPFVSVVAPELAAGMPSTHDAAAITRPEGEIILVARGPRGFQKQKLGQLDDDPALLLKRCGELGLTSLCVFGNDPLADQLRAADLVDRDVAPER